MLITILVLAAALRCWHIGAASLWTDELLSLEVSSGVAWKYFDPPTGVVLEPAHGLRQLRAEGSWGDVVRSLGHSGHPPLYFWLLRLWEGEWGEQSDAILRSLSAIASVLAILLAFDAARWLHGPRAALWAAAALALAGPQIEYAQELRGYALSVALMFGCCAAIARIERLGFTRGRVLALFCCAVALLLTHYLGFAILGALAVYCAVRLHGPARRGALIGVAAAAVIVLAAWGPFWWVQLHSFRPTLAWLSEDAPGGAGRTLARVAALPVHFFFDPGERVGAVAALAGVLFLIPALLLRRSPALLMWCVLMWTLVATLAIGDATRGTMALALPRYTLAAGAAAVVLAAVLASTAPPRSWMRVAVPAALLLACVMALPQAYARYRPDFRTLAEYLDVDCHDDGAIVLYPTVREPWYSGLLQVALTHYAPHMQRTTVLLQCPANQDLERQLAPDGVIDVVSGSLGPEQILPGCHVLTQTYFPLIGCCARVRLPDDSIMSAPFHRGTLLAPRAAR